MSQFVVLKGWNPGFNKVGLTKLVEASAHLSLSEAKLCTDRLLDGAEVEVELLDAQAAESFAAEATKLGAIVQVGTVR
jgi:hypothetical protein